MELSYEDQRALDELAERFDDLWVNPTPGEIARRAIRALEACELDYEIMRDDYEAADRYRTINEARIAAEANIVLENGVIENIYDYVEPGYPLEIFREELLWDVYCINVPNLRRNWLELVDLFSIIDDPATNPLELELLTHEVLSLSPGYQSKVKKNASSS